MKAAIDPIVWDYAKDNNLMIVSKDADMHDLSLVFGNPLKVIWLLSTVFTWSGLKTGGIERSGLKKKAK